MISLSYSSTILEVPSRCILDVFVCRLFIDGRYDWCEVIFIVVLICNSIIIRNIEHFSCVYMFSLGEKNVYPFSFKFPLRRGSTDKLWRSEYGWRSGSLY